MIRPFVSVIIPVYNDSARLRKCLAAVSRQTYPRDRYEVVVVDNASEDDARSVVAEFPGARYEREATRGAAAARNTGFRASRGEVIAFTDSDCLPQGDWIEKGVACLDEGLDKIAGGKVKVFFEDEARPTAIELYSAAVYLDQETRVRRERYAVTANAMMRRGVFESVGFFDERFGTAAREDLEWGERAAARGFAVIYAEDAVVAHPAMRTGGELRNKILRLRLGRYRHDLFKSEGRPPTWREIARNAARLFRPPVRVIVRLWRLSDRKYGLAVKFRAGLVVIWAHEMSAALDLYYKLKRRFGRAA